MRVFSSQTREVDRDNKKAVKEANMYFLVESTIALFVSFLINLFVMAVFGQAFYHKTNKDVVSAATFPPQSSHVRPTGT